MFEAHHHGLPAKEGASVMGQTHGETAESKQMQCVNQSEGINV